MLPQKDLIGVKGRLQTRIIDTPEGIKKRKTEIIAEKVTFLTSNSSRKKEEINTLNSVSKEEEIKTPKEEVKKAGK